MNQKLKFLIGLSGLVFASQAMANITFYENEGFRGRTFSTNSQANNFQRVGFNDRASSVIVDSGSWEVCEDARYSGRCVILRKGNYDSLSRMGLNDRISSVRPVARNRHYAVETPEPMTEPAYEYRRRPSEKMFEADVTSVHAVVGPATERCWIERQQVTEPSRRDPNVGGALAGALIGGVLGHQVGGGTGRDLATVGGAIAGGAIGSGVNRDSNNTYSHDVRRCASEANTTPEYWDVTYNYQGREHRIQMSSPPGATIAVNRNGEPRQ